MKFFFKLIVWYCYQIIYVKCKGAGPYSRDFEIFSTKKKKKKGKREKRDSRRSVDSGLCKIVSDFGTTTPTKKKKRKKNKKEKSFK